MNMNMRCHTCGFTGDDVQDFISTDIPGERTCPKCTSAECYIEDGDTTVCDECGADIPPVASTLVNAWHLKSCSLHPENVSGEEAK